MLKARAGNALFFGLSELNIKLLKEGRPIYIDLKEIGIGGGSITIFYGPTEEIIETRLFSMLVPSETPKN